MIEIVPSDLLVMWSVSLLYAMWKTDSFHSCLNLTTIIASLFAISVAHRLYGDPEESVRCMFVILAVSTALVWKEVPKLNRKRRWNDVK